MKYFLPSAKVEKGIDIDMNILSIDGGGIKGLYSAAFLEVLESRFDTKICNCFDLIAGTSTGGILALALAAQIPAATIVKFYKNWGPQIFPTRLKLIRLFKRFFISKYKSTILEKALRDVFEDRKLGDITNNKNSVALCIPCINAITGKPWVFKTTHDPNLIRDKDYSLWEVALATSSAPTYFPLAKVKIPNSTSSNLFLDGGLWANNPTLVALTEALTYGKKSVEDIHILSIGNINSTTTFRSDTFLRKGILLWREKIISMTLDTQSVSIDNQIGLLFKHIGLENNYVRIEYQNTSDSHRCLQEMDCAIGSNLNDLEAYGRQKADTEGMNDNIIQFFKECKNG